MSLLDNKYQRKALVVEAERLEHNRGSIKNALEFVYHVVADDEMIKMVLIDHGVKLKTYYGHRLAEFGDYIVKDANGIFSPCSPDHFITAYEKLPPEDDHVIKVEQPGIFINGRRLPDCESYAWFEAAIQEKAARERNPYFSR